MYWSHGAWRVGDKDQMHSGQTHCMAFVESDASHPTAMPSEVVWKGTASEYASGLNESQFEAVEGVSLATGTVSAQNIPLETYMLVLYRLTVPYS